MVVEFREGGGPLMRCVPEGGRRLVDHRKRRYDEIVAPAPFRRELGVPATPCSPGVHGRQQAIGAGGCIQ